MQGSASEARAFNFVSLMGRCVHMRRADSSMTTFALFQRFALLGTPLDRALLFYFLIANLLPPRGGGKEATIPKLLLVPHYLSSPRASCASAMREVEHQMVKREFGWERLNGQTHRRTKMTLDGAGIQGKGRHAKAMLSPRPGPTSDNARDRSLDPIVYKLVALVTAWRVLEVSSL